MAKEPEKTIRNDEPKAAARATVEPRAEDTQNPGHLQPYPDGTPQDPYAAKIIAHPKAMEDEPPPPETTRKAPEPEVEAKREKK
jgi:hypothetical protein